MVYYKLMENITNIFLCINFKMRRFSKMTKTRNFKKIVSILLTFALVAGIMSVLTVTASASISSGTYFIRNRNSGLFLDVDHGRTANGTRIVQWSFHGGLNQQWRVTNIGGQSVYH